MKTFEEGKTITELGIDITKKFVVVDGDEFLIKGEILTFFEDDLSLSPLFQNKNGEDRYVLLERLAYAKETYTRGELVEVKVEGDDRWLPRIYITTIEGVKYPFISVTKYEEQNFKDGKEVIHSSWELIRKIVKPKLFKIRSTNGQEVEIELDKLEELGFVKTK